ncbi:MAG: flagellar filament capping protein FliD [bacterium]|nr:flagellar filament capping protein FliD [bacterium]
MPAPPVMDLGSGMDTQGTIQKLMQIERIPLQRMQQENGLREIQIRAYEEVRKRTRDLADKSRKLYSITGAFSDRSVVSSDPGAITGQASPSADAGEQQVEVLSLASNHQIHSDPVSVDEKLPAGKFMITAGGKDRTIQFKGGNVRRLMEQLKRDGEKLFDVTGVNTDASHLLISLRSKHSGESGKMQFTDPDGLLGKIGLVQPGTVETSPEKVLFRRGELSEYKRDNGEAQAEPVEYRLLSAGRGVELEGAGAVYLKDELLKPGELTLKLRALEAAPEKTSEKKPEKEAAEEAGAEEPEANADDTEAEKETAAAEPETATVGPAISLKIGDVELKGQHIERRRVLSEEDAQATDEAEAPDAAKDPAVAEKEADAEKEKQAQDAEDLAKFLKIGIGIVTKSGEGETTKEVVREIEVGQPASEIKLNLANLAGGPDADIQGVYFFQPDGGKGRVADLVMQPAAATEKQLLPVHETSAARDAVIKVNGVEVRRSENKAITDVIQGLSLDLNRPTQGPVTVSISNNTDEITAQIQEWVASYNELMLFLRENSNTDGKKFIPPVAGEDDKNRPSPAERQGIFASDSTVRQLIATIRSQAAQSYPATLKPAFRVLADIGISTGGVGAKWEDVQYGFLQIEEKKLNEALRANPEAVRELFASDTNEDSVPDNGMAVSLEKSLRPYNRTSGGLIAARITMLKDQISSNKEEMFRKERSIENKQQSLRERFGRMEQAVQRNRSMGDYLKRNGPQ